MSTKSKATAGPTRQKGPPKARAKSNPKPPPALKPTKAATAAPTSKLDQIVVALKSSKGASLQALMDITGWQAHSVHGAIAGALKSKRGLAIPPKHLNSVSVKPAAAQCARITDAMVWRRGEHYDPLEGRFTYHTEKTDEEVSDLPVSLRLRAMFDDPPSLYLIQNPDGLPYRPVTDDHRLGDDFDRVRKLVVARGGPRLVLRQLRHSAIKHATDAGASLEDVQGATAHASERTVKIYMRRSAQKAERLQKLRGIID